MTPVPFNDLYAQYLSLKEEIDDVICDVIRNSLFVRGPYVEKFETIFASMMERRFCVSCANGTDSLYIAMKALGLRPGDEVIVPAHSWISSSESVTQAGGKVVFCDTDTSTFTMDACSLEAKITKNTVGIIPVHLYGQPADMDNIMRISKKYKLWVLEDCAQAHIARYNGRLVGTFGDVASFSFYPGKNLGAMGDAGALITNNEALATRMASFARHGGLEKGDHQIEGINSRLDGLQAAILTVKLPHLSRWTELRQKRSRSYSAALAGLNDIITPIEAPKREHVWHLYVIKHGHRNALAKYLGQAGISTAINYPTALPFLPAYSRLRHKPSVFPNAYENQSACLSLPLYPEMTDGQQDAVVNAIKKYCNSYC